MKKKVILTKGLPASGKTTWARQFIKENPSYKRINKDDLRMMIDGGWWSGENEKTILAARNNLISLFLERGNSVIVDDTNLHEKHFNQIRELVPTDVEVEIKDFTDVSLSECIKRDALRANGVGSSVITKMYRQYLQKDKPRLSYNSSLPSAVICDLDGTLALFDRSPYDTEKCDKDKLNDQLWEILVALHKAAVSIILVSGREDKWREKTISWLQHHQVPFAALHMRKTDDKRSDETVKREIYEEHIKGAYNLLGAFDDRPRVIRVWRSLGIQVYQLNDEEF